MIKKVLLFVAGIAIGTALVAMGHDSKKIEAAETKTYCDMVALWVKTGGEYGWPAYRGSDSCQSKNH